MLARQGCGKIEKILPAWSFALDATPDGSSSRVDESLVARLWDAQHPFSLPLKTVDGDEIGVVYRGRRRFDRGPDFPGALIALPGERILSGDLEIHVRTSDWRRHGHQRDPAYGNVVLHVVLWHDTTAPCLRYDGAAVPVVELAPHLLESIESLSRGNMAGAPMPAPCLPASGADPRLAALLEGCGMARFEEKARRYEGDLSILPSDEVLYRGIADALGYSQNREPFRRLTELLPLETLLRYRDSAGRVGAEMRGSSDSSLTAHHSSPLRLEALLFGAAGLLPSQRAIPVDGPYAGEMEAVWGRDGERWVGDSMSPAEWQLFRVRPINFPTRRLAGLAEAASRWPEGGLATHLLEIAGATEARRGPRMLEAQILGAATAGYWAEHSDFGQTLGRPSAPVGRGRAAEVAINVLLPFLAARARADGHQPVASWARTVYALYPKRADNEITRYVASQITGVARPPASRSGCRQQGLLRVYRNWCEVKSCGTCPVASLGIQQGRAAMERPAGPG